MPILIVIAILIILVLIGCLDLRCAVKKAAGRDNQAARKEVRAEIALEDDARNDRADFGGGGVFNMSDHAAGARGDNAGDNVQLAQRADPGTDSDAFGVGDDAR